MLVHAWVTDTASLSSPNGGKIPNRGFILGTPKKVYHFLAASHEEKNSWFRELQNKIFAQKRLFNQVNLKDPYTLHVYVLPYLHVPFSYFNFQKCFTVYMYECVHCVTDYFVV